MPVLDNVEQLIGNTPLVRLNRVTAGLKATICLKMEGENPGKSVKDRLAFGMIRDMEAAGEITPGKTTLIEATSGNTGIALAMLGAVRGYKVILTMPEQMSLERRVVLRSYGAEVVLTPKGKGLKGALKKAQMLEDEINAKGAATGENAKVTWQFETPSNARIHKETTGPEIFRDTEGKVDYVVSGIGTGGTITGVAQHLKEKGSKCKFIAVEPEESAAITANLDGAKDWKPSPHKVQGMGAGFVPNTLDLEVVDKVMKVHSDVAIDTSRRLATEEGILAGISAGAILAAAMEIAKTPEAEGKLIVAICPSQGERYLSTALFQSLMDKAKALTVLGEDAFPEKVVLEPPKLIPPKGPFVRPTRGGIKASVAEAVGGTALVRLNRLTKGLNGRVLVKMESENPGKSVKDRLGLALIQDAEAAGLAVPGKTTLIEATSGNTGIALAMLGAAKGYKVILTMPDTMSLERRAVLLSFGAQVELTTAKKGLAGARWLAQEIAKKMNAEAAGSALVTEQFENMSNALMHKQTTGPEIWDDTEGKVDYVVSGVGTGGTVTGIAECFKERGNKDCKFIAVEPEESQAMGHKRAGKEFKPAPHKIQGMGAGLVPNAMNLDLCDEILPVHSDEAIAVSQRLAREEAILCGISSGAIVAAALKVAARPDSEGKTIVAIIPSAGERYLSTALFASLYEECQKMPVVPESEL